MCICTHLEVLHSSVLLFFKQIPGPANWPTNWQNKQTVSKGNGVKISNTFLLEKNGWSGLLIDALLSNVEACQLSRASPCIHACISINETNCLA